MHALWPEAGSYLGFIDHNFLFMSKAPIWEKSGS
jgi:hypothetical protein